MSSALPHQLLDWFMKAPEFIDDCDDLCAADFPSGLCRQVFEAENKIWENDRPETIPSSALIAELGGGDSVVSFVRTLTEGIERPCAATVAIVVRELKKENLTRHIGSQLQKELAIESKTGTLDLDEILQDVDALKALNSDHAGPFDPDKVLMTGAVMQALDIHVNWTVSKLIPERALTLIYGPGGVGKTWLALSIAKAVATGAPFLGLTTKQKPVFYIDRENPWPLLIERVRKMDIRDVRFWHLSFATQPPKFDAPDWEIYKKLPTGGLILFDTARSFHDGEENSSQDAAMVMNRLKELRERDNDVVLLHHTPRANERASKGSTAWEDLADQALAFHRVRRGSLKEIKEEIDAAEFDPDALYHFGTGRKTRYEPAKLYITANYETGEFTLAEDPGAAAIDALAEYIAGDGGGQNQTEIFAWTKENLTGAGRKDKLVALLKRGEREGRWRSHLGLKGAKFYELS